MVVVVLVLRVVVLSQYDVLVFIIMVRYLFVFGLFKRAKYIRLETKKINRYNSLI